MKLYRSLGIVGSRGFTNYNQLVLEVLKHSKPGDWFVSGGAIGVDSMAQRFAKETGHRILIIYPNYAQFGKPATFIRNKEIVEESDKILAFYQKGRFGMGGTSNTAHWARQLGKELHEFEEE